MQQATPKEIRQNSNKKKTGLSMKWRIFLYIALFSGILLVLLWLFQTVFLDDFYEAIKLKRTNDVMSEIEAILESESDTMLKDILAVAKANNVNLQLTTSLMQIVVSIDAGPSDEIFQMRDEQFQILYIKALENGGKYELRWGGKKEFFLEYNGTPYNEVEIDQLPDKVRDREQPENVISVSVVDVPSGTQYVVFLNTRLSPVNETVSTIRTQLIYISAIMLFMTIVLAIVMSKRLTKPLANMNDAANQLATGDYNVHFDDNTGYREIDQLGDTLNYAATELSRVDHLRNELLANISHDLRTPLTMITGYGEIMRDLPGEMTAENIDIIVGEAKHLSDLVNDALDISKLRTGEERPNPDFFNLTDSVRVIVERFSALMEPRAYKIIFEYDDEVTVFADEIKISQVVYNLINNALNYTGADKTVTVRQVIEKSAGGNSVRIDVTDTGSGIREEDLPLIFDRYYKGESSKRTAIGTGLGLAIVKAILEMHRAEYGVISSLGKGTTFWFRLKTAAQKS